MVQSAPMSPREILPLVSAAVLLVASAACRAERPAHLAGGGADTGPAAPVPPMGAIVLQPYFANMTIERNASVPMRDGVVLRADVYRPAAPGRFPTLVYRTPYGKDGLVESGSEPTIVRSRSEEHTSELQSPCNLVCRLLLEKKKTSRI